MSYHDGSIWPHDNALIALGLARYGLKHSVEQLFKGLFDAATYMDLRRLPELFCGFQARKAARPDALSGRLRAAGLGERDAVHAAGSRARARVRRGARRNPAAQSAPAGVPQRGGAARSATWRLRASICGSAATATRCRWRSCARAARSRCRSCWRIERSSALTWTGGRMRRKNRFVIMVAGSRLAMRFACSRRSRRAATIVPRSQPPVGNRNASGPPPSRKQQNATPPAAPKDAAPPPRSPSSAPGRRTACSAATCAARPTRTWGTSST